MNPDIIQPPPSQPTPQPPMAPLPSRPSRRSSRGEGLRSAASTIAILLIAPLVAIILTAFVFQSYEVDGPSMETTLQNHDRLIVVKVPRTLARITHHDYIPNRGDIVIFNKTDDFDFNGTQQRQLIKRVVGLPGDRVVVKDGIITIYNKDHPNGFQPDKTLPYGNVIATTPGNIDTTIPKGQIFVNGDNRTNSLDSRSFGPIPASAIVGKLVLRIYPFGKAETF